MNPYRRLHAHWDAFFARYGYGLPGAGEPFDRRLRLRVASSTAVMVERAVARTHFGASFLIRESVLRGFAAAEADLVHRIAEARRAGLRHPPLAILGRVSSLRPLRYGRRRLDPWSLIGETPWSVGPRPVLLQSLVTRSLWAAATRSALALGVPRGPFVRHALALGWSVVCNEIMLLLALGFRPAYLFPSLGEPLPRYAPTSPWHGPNRQPVFGLSWIRIPGVDLARFDPQLTEPDPADPFLSEL